MTKHFGAYPFNHGYIGGILALDRHGPHAAHGEDMVIIHAPHVGYDPISEKYGIYRREQVANDKNQISTCCGKVAGTLAPYRNEYRTTLGRISVRVEGDVVLVSLSNQVLRDCTDETLEGLFLNFDLLLEPGALGQPVMMRSASQVYRASAVFSSKVREVLADTPAAGKGRPLWRSLSEPGLEKLLDPEMFCFRRNGLEGEENRLERILVPHMPFILTAPWEADLAAALVIAQYEFDRAVFSVSSEPSYRGKNLVLISGLNIDVSPDPQHDAKASFPATMFLPWAAYVQVADGRSRVLEQGEVVEALMSVAPENEDAIDIEVSIAELFSRTRKPVNVFDRKTAKLIEPAVL